MDELKSPWLQPVDIYCERTDASFWSEPINAISNLAFILAMVLAYRTYQRHKAQLGHAYDVLWLTFLMGLIGIGSGLFHTIATRWAELADVIPITLFQFSYIAIFMVRLTPLPWWVSIPAGWGAFAGLTYIIQTRFPPDALNGSIGYLSSFITLVLIGDYLRRKKHPAGIWVRRATVVFMLSLSFRTLDMEVCDWLPVGTHFLWHCCNGVMLYCLTRSIITAREIERELNSQPPSNPAAAAEVESSGAPSSPAP